MRMHTIMHIRHEFMKMAPPFGRDGSHLVEHVHQHRLAAADAAIDIQSLDGGGRPGLAREHPAERALLLGGLARLQIRKDTVKMRRHTKLGGIGLQGASCRQCVELFNDTMIVIRQRLHG
ncbi:hypothetical protein D3C78_930570 [compost metagenome]